MTTHQASTDAAPPATGFTLMEVLAVLAILAVVSAVIIPRVGDRIDSGDAAACHACQGEIELQTQLWRRVNGSWPASNLSDIGASSEYFPEGVPTCPVDGSAYTIDSSTGLVVGHEH